jgi:hypothetical protein
MSTVDKIDEKPKAHEEQANQKSTASPFFSQSP